MVIGLDGAAGGVFADYSQWEAFRSDASRAEPSKQKAVFKEPRSAAPPDEPKKKLSYLQQREWDGMEAKILEAEHELSASRQELEAFASDANRVAEVYEKTQAAQRRVDELYARWAELEALIAK